MSPTRLLACTVLLALLVPGAVAHGPPAPNDPESRLLVDHNDDCGETNDLTGRCRGTHDLIAVYVREAWDAAHGDVVVFRFLANGGDLAGGLKDVFTFKAGSTSKTMELSTANNRDFTVGGNVPALAVGKGTSLNDPAAPGRFSVEVTVGRDQFGDVGTALTGFKVEAYKGTTKGDYMPGGYVGPLGDVPNPDQGSNPTNAAVAEYRLRGPAYYVTVTAPGPQEVASGGEAIVQVDVRNTLRNTAQSLTFTLAGQDGVTARFHDPNAGDGEGYSDTLRIDLPKAGSTFVHVALAGERAGATGTLTLTITTDQGGRSQTPIPYGVPADGASPTTTTPPTDGGSDKGAPGPAPLAVLAAIAVAALARRRA